MSIYTTRSFDRWAHKQGLPASSLCNAVLEIKKGLVDADLGGGLVKKRIARPGQGRAAHERWLTDSGRDAEGQALVLLVRIAEE
jgi:hypothetical protein